jgi:hypothetical protein
MIAAKPMGQHRKIVPTSLPPLAGQAEGIEKKSLIV